MKEEWRQENGMGERENWNMRKELEMIMEREREREMEGGREGIMKAVGTVDDWKVMENSKITSECVSLMVNT